MGKAQLGHQTGPAGNLVNDKQFILPISSEIQDVHVINAAKNGIVLLINDWQIWPIDPGVLMNLDTTFGTPLEVPFCTIGLYIIGMGSF